MEPAAHTPGRVWIALVPLTPPAARPPTRVGKDTVVMFPSSDSSSSLTAYDPGALADVRRLDTPRSCEAPTAKVTFAGADNVQPLGRSAVRTFSCSARLPELVSLIFNDSVVVSVCATS